MSGVTTAAPYVSGMHNSGPLAPMMAVMGPTDHSFPPDQTNYNHMLQQASVYNKRLCTDRSQRLPFMDHATGVAQRPAPWLHRIPQERIQAVPGSGFHMHYPGYRWRRSSPFPSGNQCPPYYAMNCSPWWQNAPHPNALLTPSNLHLLSDPLYLKHPNNSPPEEMMADHGMGASPMHIPNLHFTGPHDGGAYFGSVPFLPTAAHPVPLPHPNQFAPPHGPSMPTPKHSTLTTPNCSFPQPPQSPSNQQGIPTTNGNDVTCKTMNRVATDANESTSQSNNIKPTIAKPSDDDQCSQHSAHESPPIANGHTKQEIVRHAVKKRVPTLTSECKNDVNKKALRGLKSVLKRGGPRGVRGPNRITSALSRALSGSGIWSPEEKPSSSSSGGLEDGPTSEVTAATASEHDPEEALLRKREDTLCEELSSSSMVLFSCEVCTTRYRSTAGLRYHYQTQHQGYVPQRALSASATKVTQGIPIPKVGLPPSRRGKRGIYRGARGSRGADLSAPRGDSSYTLSAESPGPGEAQCHECHSVLHNTAVKDGSDFVQRCSKCARTSHTSCLRFTSRMRRETLRYNWQCIDCKKCWTCGTTEDDEEMLFCDECDRGFHMYCLVPALSTPPDGNWSCQLCKPSGDEEVAGDSGEGEPATTSSVDMSSVASEY